jgi:hypothetical protein
MTMSLSLTPRRLLVALAGLIAADLLLPATTFMGPAPANAVIGRPATPVSYAGVARRTTRRTVVATTAVVAATPPPPTTTTVVVQQPPPPPPPPPQ